jgi:glyoxylase-like metal-dependent hydrolase (beta-lactamase superfamily II)
VNAQNELQVKCFVEQVFQENSYLLYLRQGGQCWIVDPGFPPQTQEIAEAVKQAELKPSGIMLTHGHADHIAGVGPLKKRWPDVPVCIGRADADMLNTPQKNLSAQFGLPFLTSVKPNCDLEPNQQLLLDGLTWTVLDTSGHSPGGRSLYCPSQHVVITGDALFAGSIGRTDLPGSNHQQLLDNIAQNLLTLPRQTKVLPGHGPATTVADEQRSNPFLTDMA